MSTSEKNKKYLKYDIAKWQEKEVSALRAFCHKNNKDFYVIDNPPSNTFSDVNDVIEFIRDICSSYSCLAYAHQCAQEILNNTTEQTIVLLDGDKTISLEDSSNKVFGYKTNLYDGNFYTGYQAWKQYREFLSYDIPEIVGVPVKINEAVLQMATSPAYILTSGHKKIWKQISMKLGIPYFAGMQMAAETKLFITKELQNAGRKVIAVGDGMNDYYMLKQADYGKLVRKANGEISRSLKGQDLEGIQFV